MDVLISTPKMAEKTENGGDNIRKNMETFLEGRRNFIYLFVRLLKSILEQRDARTPLGSWLTLKLWLTNLFMISVSFRWKKRSLEFPFTLPISILRKTPNIREGLATREFFQPLSTLCEILADSDSVAIAHLLLGHDAGVEQAGCGEDTAECPDQDQDEAHLPTRRAPLQRMHNGDVSAD